jgi:erythronate-4-phosphate dehydrogenase
MKSPKISIAADQHIFKIEQLEHQPGIQLHLYDPHSWNPSDFHHSVDALLIRTVTSVDEELLKALGDRLKYIGTATSGSDHVGKKLLSNRGITFSDAKGCNSKAVAEYTLTSLLHWCNARNIQPNSLTIGVAGIGHVGSKVDHLCREAGFKMMCYDPIRRNNPEDNFIGCTESELFSSDVLSLHTPLTNSKESDFPTQNWISEDLIQHHKNVKLWINAARGGIIDDEALATEIFQNQTEAIIDCWKNEPNLSESLLQTTFLATPHIAGYSIESKLNATKMCVSACHKHFNLADEIVEHEFSISDKKTSSLTDDLKNKSPEEILNNHGLLSYQKELKDVSAEHRPQRFKEIRTEHPLRREFGWLL